MSARGSVGGAVGMRYEDRAAIIIKRWNEGVAGEDLARSVGMTARRLREEVRRMRRRGIVLQDRSNIGSSRGTSHGNAI